MLDFAHRQHRRYCDQESGVNPPSLFSAFAALRRDQLRVPTAKLILTLALIPAFSPGRRSRRRQFSGWRETIRPIPSHDISQTRRMILPLLGERAGVREVVITNLANQHAAPLGLGILGWPGSTNMSRLRRWLKPQTLLFQHAPKLAERLDCGAFSTAFRPHEDHPLFRILRPPESAAKAGALQTLRAIRES